MTVEQAAALIGCTPDHVRHLHQDGKLHGERIGRRLLIFRRADVESFKATPRHAGGRPRKPDAGPRGREEGEHDGA